MKLTTPNSLKPTYRTTRRITGRLKTWTLLALTVSMMAAQTPCEAKINWKHVLGVVATVGGVGVGLGGHPEIGVALIGLQGKLLSSAAIIANNTNIITGPDVTPLGFRGLGSPTPSPAAMDAMLAMNCPDAPVAGTPNEQFSSRKPTCSSRWAATYVRRRIPWCKATFFNRCPPRSSKPPTLMPRSA